MFRYALLDPRPIPAAVESNEKILGAGQVFGVEVTVPALAARCTLGNLDPQHSGGNATRAAIEGALEVALPPEGAMLATVRPDLDAVGAMAVLGLRVDGADLPCYDCVAGGTADGGLCSTCGNSAGIIENASWDQILHRIAERITLVARADKAARGGWPGVRPLPTTENPWPEDSDGQGTARPLAAIGAAIADHKLPIEERVAVMREWLLTGEEPLGYRGRTEAERAELVAALESGAIEVSLVADGRIAVVESTHRAASMVGYMRAPVIVARNPTFRMAGGEPHVKFTVGTFEPDFADIKSALTELASLEEGWGGSPTVGGSKQGVASTLTTDEVVRVVTKHLAKN